MSGSAPRHRRLCKQDKFLFGVAYYPEHWREEDRQEDPDRMAVAGVNVVRMGEFAWDLMERVEGEYDFAFFDEQIARLANLGISTIFCTPTATPPRWLTVQYPDTLRIDRDGRRMEHGTRQHCCTNSARLREYGWRITSALTTHFAGNPSVIGWQTDNELNCHFSECYCPSCHEAFINWCRRRYNNEINLLNQAWGTAFWSMSYTDFEQLVLPYDRPARWNPGHMLDYWRFLSDTTAEFQREQVEILRKGNPNWFITHNGLMANVDYWKFAEDLDFLGVDIYPGFGGQENIHGVAFIADRCRSYGGSFMVPELESGPGGQVGYILPTPRPGQMRMWLYQVIAHGADSVMHFRWRSCRFGAEEYWCGVLDHDNKPRRRYEEFAREGIELRHIGKEMLGTSVDISAAVLIEHDQDLAWKTMPLGMPSPESQSLTLHGELWRRKLPVGLVEAHDSFEGPRLLIVPSFTMMDDDLASRLTEFARQGGVLVVMAWSGTRDRFGRITPLSAPGLLAELAGVTVEEFGKLEKGENSLTFADGTTASGFMWYELLRPTTAKPVARWSREHMAGTVGLTVNQVGEGKVFYVGTYAAAEEASALLGPALDEAKIEPVVAGLPEGVEAVRRSGKGKSLLFLLNHSCDEQLVSRVPAGVDLISGKTITGSLTLPPKEVAVIHVGRNLSVK